MRPSTFSHFCAIRHTATPLANQASLISSASPPQSTKATRPSKPCRMASTTQLTGLLPAGEVVNPTMMQDVMPVKAAR